jgi:iron complex transport system ATP-binding protein
MIKLEAVTVVRGGREIISNYSEAIPAGLITVILGPNGSGKSTLLAAIAGDHTPVKGTITIGGIQPTLTPAAQLSKIRAMTLQNQNYTLGFTVKEIVEMAGDSNEVMDALGLAVLANRHVTTLSGGEVQRVAIATAIAQRTPVLLLDEPLSAQDVHSRARIIGLLKKLAEAGTTVVVVAHANESELAWADKIITQ